MITYHKRGVIMDYKVLGWIQIVGGVLALLSSGRVGYTGMMGMMGYYGGLGVTILAVLFIITGIHYVTKKDKKR